MTPNTPSQKSRAFTAQAKVASARKDKFMGKEYVVVPVVAMIEGVRFGANQDAAELGLADDFGKYPVSWNNRPLVVNHPKVKGAFVSANLLSVTEDYVFGFTANAKISKGKLKMEAWIDPSRADEVDGVQDFLDQIDAKEMIEVSVGFFADMEASKGSFKGQQYAGIWRNIVPDHLAFLTSAEGACSVKDGCGVPRLNQEALVTLKTDTPAKAYAASCSCQTAVPVTECSCQTPKPQGDQSQEDLSTAASSPSALMEAPSEQEAQEHASSFLAQSIANDLTDTTVRSVLSAALKNLYAKSSPRTFAYLTYYSAGDNSTAVFSVYTSDIGSYEYLGIRFSMAEDGAVTFEGDPFEVRVITKVVPVKDNSQENDMSNQEKNSGTPAPEANASETVITPVVPVAPVAQAAPVVETPAAPAVLSREDALKALSTEDRAEFESALAVQAEQKASAIKALKDSGRCKFDDAYLNAQSLATLGNLVELSAVPSYEGRAAPSTPKAQSSEDDNVVPMPPSVFAARS